MNFILKSVLIFSMILIPQIARADLNLVERVLFSEKSYAKEMEVQAYILTKEQACAALDDPSQKLIQPENKELFNKNTFLFIRVRNNGTKHAWGTLACKVPTYHAPIKLSIYGVGRSSKTAYNVYLIQLGSLMLVSGETGVPKISIEWDELYTK